MDGVTPLESLIDSESRSIKLSGGFNRVSDKFGRREFGDLLRGATVWELVELSDRFEVV